MSTGRVSLDSEEEQVHSKPHRHKKGLWAAVVLAYGSLGVIYGDVGTSPLYTFESTFHHTPTQADVLGVTGLIFWTMTLIVLIKYVLIVLRADDSGEGGTFALYALLCRALGITPLGNQLGEADKSLARYSTSPAAVDHLARRNQSEKNSPYRYRLNAAIQGYLASNASGRMALLVVVVLATAMVVGDGILTPSISVLSAVGGLQAAPGISMPPGAVPGIAAAILVVLFVSQRYGTGMVGRAFAPVVILWLGLNAGIAISNLAEHGGSIFAAINPAQVVWFFQRNGQEGWLMLGGVMLCITGAEAMYADLGHFNRKSISLGFCLYVYPCLMLTYFGQGAHLLVRPEDYKDVFWRSVPRPIFWPVFVAAILASVVASQALISGAFSIMRQAAVLGMSPKVTIIHTGKNIEGQVYLPEINYILMVLCIAVTAGFQSSDNLGHAYGVAVMSVMAITTLLAALTMSICWDTHPLLYGVFLLVYLPLELTYLSATLAKMASGGWVSPLVAVIVSTIKLTWWWGSSLKAEHTRRNKVPVWKLLLERTQEPHLEDPASKQLANPGPGGQLIHPPHLSAGAAPSNVCLVATGEPVATIAGLGLYYSDNSSGTPPIMMHVLHNMPAVFQTSLFVTVKFMPLPVVEPHERFLVRREAKFSSIFHVVVRYGYLDRPDHGAGFVDELVAVTVQHILDRNGIGGEGAAEKLMELLPDAHSSLNSLFKRVVLVAEGEQHHSDELEEDHAGAIGWGTFRGRRSSSTAGGAPEGEPAAPEAGAAPIGPETVVASVVLTGSRAPAQLPAGGAVSPDPSPARRVLGPAPVASARASRRSIGDLPGAMAAAADTGFEAADGDRWYTVSTPRRTSREPAVQAAPWEAEQARRNSGENKRGRRGSSYTSATEAGVGAADNPSAHGGVKSFSRLQSASAAAGDALAGSAPAATGTTGATGEGEGGSAAAGAAASAAAPAAGKGKEVEVFELTVSQLQALKDAANVVRAYRSHYVHLLGRVNLKVMPNSNVLRRALLGSLYGFLAVNSIHQPDAWNIPTRNLIELGMEVEV